MRVETSHQCNEIDITFADDIIRHYFEDSSVALSLTLLSGQVFPNAAFCKLLGYTQSELSMMRWQHITHPDDLDLSQQQVDKLLNGECKSTHFRKRYITKTGDLVWVEVHTTLYPDKHFSAPYLLTTLIDVTDQIQYQENLEKTKNYLSSFINASSDIIILKDENHRYTMVNRALEDSFGIQSGEAIGKTDDAFMEESEASRCYETDRQALEQNRTIVSIEKVGDRYFETRKFPMQIEKDGRGIGAYIRDVTESYQQKQLIEKMSATNRIITECFLKPFSEIQEQLDFALHEALKLCESKYGYIYFYDEVREEFSLNSWTTGVMADCEVVEKQTKYQLEKTGIWGEVVRQRRPMIVNDFPAPNPLKKGYPEGHVAISNFMSMPIFDNGKIVAVVAFANKTGDYTDSDLETMTVLMSGVWIATQKRNKEKETEILLKRMKSMINDHGAIMLVVRPDSGDIIEANEAAVKFYGYTREELLSMNARDINTASEEEITNRRLLALHKEQQYFTIPHRVKNGEVRIIDAYISPIDYLDETVLLSIIFDVTKREQMRDQNEYLANHDYMTGLYNRKCFREDFSRRVDRGDYPVSIILGDVNSLRLYNDTFGHQKGDQMLIDIANRMRNCIPKDATLARIAGDEFAFLVSNLSEEEVRKCLDLVDSKVNMPIDSNTELNGSISFGYGHQREPNVTLDALLKEAETYMYNRKYYNSRSARSNTVYAIMETLFTKSEREEKHSLRVGKICEAIGRCLNLDEKDIDRLRVAGYLHDIGKIGIDEKVLNKNGSLDKAEWEAMKLHPAKGAEILEKTVEYAGIADIVLCHHERMDGNGYPNGLRGDEIPVESRIIAVADAFDAMTNARSYRAAMSKEAAIKELRMHAGTQHDQMIVDTFIQKAVPNIVD